MIQAGDSNKLPLCAYTAVERDTHFREGAINRPFDQTDLEGAVPQLLNAEPAPPAMPETIRTDTAPLPGSRLLPKELCQAEPFWHLRLFEAIAGFIVLGFFYFIVSFWAPASPGVDQNGYLVGGKQIALSGSSGIKPANPFQFVGGMWVMVGDPSSDNIWYYPKYPIGLPLLNAIPLWINWDHGKIWSLYISPACTSLALLAMFLLVRTVAGSFMGILGMLVLGINYVTLMLANMPWSHAPALCFATWGMFLLLRWWQSGAIWRGALAGFLLGYAVTIRYTEGVLLLPLLMAALLTIRWRHRATWLRAAVPLAAWAVPALWLVGFNWFAMHSITGYDTTNESTGFTVENLAEKWEYMFQQLYDYGMFLILPLAMLGLMVMWRQSWRLACFLLLWLLPGIAIYTAYYWGGRMPGLGYLRFYLTLFPPVVLAAMWYMRHGGWEANDERGTMNDELQSRSSFPPIGAGAIVAMACWIGLRTALPALQRELAINSNLAFTCETVVRNVPTGSILVIDQRGWMGGLLNFIQWRGDYELYAANAFRGGGPAMRERTDPDQPNPLQAARREYLKETVYAKLSSADLQRRQEQIVANAIEESRRVFLVQPVDNSGFSVFRPAFRPGPGLTVKPVTKWREPAPVYNATPSPLSPPQRGFGPNRQPENWQLMEVIRKLPAAPTTSPQGGR